MMPEDHAESRGPDERQDDEGALEEALAAYIDRLNRGEMLDEEIVLTEQPEIGSELWDRLKVFQTVGAGAQKEEPLGTLGDYTLRRQIGRGGMGVVYEAWENSMDRAVALKVLPSAIAADSRATTRFLREAQTAGKLNHPNVVGVFSTGVKEGTPWYAMEYVEGETLSQILARIKDAEPEADTPFGPKDDVAYFGSLARAFADVADGLQHAHSRGVTHRDIKPSNLILDSEADRGGRAKGRLRILDFGLARLEGQESLTLSGDFVGTPLYMSPEQARRKKIPVDHRTDVYSLGATMYEAICGRPPFRGRDHADTLSQIIERDPPAPRKVHPHVPRDLETIVLKCLRKELIDRYGSSEALAQDLRRFARGDAVEARPLSLPARARRLVYSHRRWLLAGAAIAIAAALAPWLVTLMIDRSRLGEPDPFDIDTALRLAYRVRAEGKLVEAEDLLESMLRRAPTSPQLRLAFADLLTSHGSEDQALRELALAFASTESATASEVHTQLSEFLIYETARDLSPLDSILTEARRRGFSVYSSTGMTALALCLLRAPRENDPSRALELARAALEKTDRPAPHQLATLAIVLRSNRLLEEADEAFRALIDYLSVNASSDRVRTSLGRVALLEDFSEGFRKRWVLSQSDGEHAVVRARRGDTGDLEIHVQSTKATPRSEQRWIDLVRVESDDPVYAHGWYRVQLRSNAPGCHAGVVLRRSDTGVNRTGYRVSLVPTYGSCLVERVNPSAQIGEVKIPALQDSFKEDWMLEVGMIGEEFSVKLWRPEKDPEPEKPQLLLTDGWHRSGQVALKVVAWWNRASTRIDAAYSRITFTPYIPEFRTAPGAPGRPR